MTRTSNKVSNEVFLDNVGIIHCVYHGTQNFSAMHDATEHMLKIVDILIKNDRPVRILIDMRDMGPYDQAARILEMRARTVLPFWKLAFVTAPNHPEQEQISRKLTLMSGRRKEIRYFEHEDDAVGWLMVNKIKGVSQVTQTRESLKPNKKSI